LILLDKILRAGEGRAAKDLAKIATKVNQFEPTISALTDEQLRAQTDLLKAKFADGQSLDDLLAARTGVNAGNIRSMRRASAPTVLTDDVNRTKGTFGDPNNPMDFLNSLQQAVASGIEEITGMDQQLLRGVEEQEQKQIPQSLFNPDLKIE
jgi:hypothetical protein